MLDPRFRPGTPFSAEDIDELETILRRTLPADYREFVQVYGDAFVGGTIGGDDNLSLLSFFGTGTKRRIFKTLQSFTDLRDDGVLPVADCELGNLYVLDRDNAVHHINDYGGTATAQKVAPSFGEFLALIVVQKE